MTISRGIRISQERSAHVTSRVYVLKEVVLEFIRSRPVTESLPGVADFAVFPQIKAILEKPKSKDVTRKSFDAVKPLLPQVAEHWKRTATTQLLKHLVVGRDDDGNLKTSGNPGDLELAVTWFFCPSCERELTFPGVLEHRCTRRQGTLNLTPTTREDDFLNGIRLATSETTWNRESELIFAARRSTIAHHLIALCGKDPHVTTTKHMDELNPRFVCRDCSLLNGEIQIMTWRRAVRNLTSMP